jgi:hypothetical protein
MYMHGEEYIESAHLEEIYKTFNEMIMKKPDSFKKMYKQYHEWWQSLMYWNGDLTVF